MGQLCLNRTCQSSFSFSASTFLNDQLGDYLPFILSGGFTWRFSRIVAALIEPMYAVAVGDGGIEGAEGFLLNYGIRISGPRWGVDVAFVKPFGEDVDDPLILGVPWVSFTYRTEWAPNPSTGAAPQGMPAALQMPSSAAW